MADLFDRAANGDSILTTDLNQVFDAWEAVDGLGIPLRLTEVSSAYSYAGDFRNKDASGQHLRVLNAADESLMRFLGSIVYLDKNMTVASAVTVDGVDISGHIHGGGTGDAPKLTNSSYTENSVGIAALSAGGIYMPKRQGGSATQWGTSGVTDYTVLGKVQVLGGTISPEGTWTPLGTTMEYCTATVIFPTPFAFGPIAFATPIVTIMNQYCLYAEVVAASDIGLTIRLWHNADDGTARDNIVPTSKSIYWLALGMKA